MMLALLIAFACLIALPSCGRRAAQTVVAGAAKTVAGGVVQGPPAPTSTADADAQLKQARRERDEIAGKLDAKEGQIDRLEKERGEITQQDLMRRLAWFGGIVLIGVLASVGLWFVLPAGLKSWAVYGGLGCLGVAAAAFALRTLVPYLELIGWGLVAGGVLFGLWKLTRFKNAAKQAAAYGEKLEAAFAGIKDWVPTEQHELIDALIASVKHEAAGDQADAGVRTVLAAIRCKDPKKPTLSLPAVAP